ncbi:hypothetical protein GF377_00055 [candidate division GN15 bacterium]|nr:hypothetical protein [candidate division GN15 bacterium]
MRQGGGILLVMLVLGTASVVAANPSTDFGLPSQDELALALEQGDITPDQYALLRELLRDGIDSTNSHLLDLILDMGSLPGIDSASTVPAGIARGPVFEERVRGSLNHRFYKQFEDYGRSWYRTRVRAEVRARWRLAMDIDRSQSGRERFTGRSLEYVNDRGWLRSLQVGTYSARFGLGALLGYRGKLVAGKDKLDAESMVYPDNGAFNGARLDLEIGGIKAIGMFSLQRDPQYRLATSAVHVEDHLDDLEISLTGVSNQLTNRLSEASLDRFGVSGTVEYRYEAGRLTSEIGWQAGSEGPALIGLVEGRHRAGCDIRYALWAYGDGMVDLSSGSKAGALSRTVSVDGVDFSYRAKRPGQEGGLAQVRTGLVSEMALTTKLLYAGFSREYFDIDLSASVDVNVAVSWTAALVWTGEWQRRPLSDNGHRSERHRFRGEMRFNSDKLLGKTYIGYTMEYGSNEQRSYWSLFTSGRYRVRHRTGFEAWARLGRIAAQRIEYAYAYLRGYQLLIGGLEGAVKIAHRYNRSSVDRHGTTLTFEVSATL